MQQLNFIKVLAPIFFVNDHSNSITSGSLKNICKKISYSTPFSSHEGIYFNPNILLLKFFVILTKVTGSTHNGKSIFDIFSIFSIFSIEKQFYCFFSKQTEFHKRRKVHVTYVRPFIVYDWVNAHMHSVPAPILLNSILSLVKNLLLHRLNNRKRKKNVF